MHYILIVEDDTTLREGLCSALQKDDIVYHSAATLAEAREMLQKQTFDLLLLDCNLPDGNGTALCREVSGQIPVVFLTVRDGEMDEVAAFRAGASDYIKKPFSLTVLQERIRVVLGRNGGRQCYEDSRFRFDFTDLSFSADGVKLYLSATEQKLLSLFCRHKGQILERQQLMGLLWDGEQDFVDENTLSVTVKRLRDKLGTDCIGTVYGLGYVWKGAKP